MTATRPPHRSIPGRFITLEPLERRHIPELFAAIGTPAVFAGGYGGGPAGYRADLDGFTEFALRYYDWDVGNVYGVRIATELHGTGGAGGDDGCSGPGPHAGELVGTTTFGRIDEKSESGEIGWTAYSPLVWGTQVNVEAKLLLFGQVFDAGFGRVRIAADVLNERSRRAILGIGATFEGINRRDKPRADGSWRDTAVYSVIVDDWPRVKTLLEERLARYEGSSVLFRGSP